MPIELNSDIKNVPKEKKEKLKIARQPKKNIANKDSKKIEYESKNKTIKKQEIKKPVKKSNKKKTLPTPTYVQFTKPPEPIQSISPEYPKSELDRGIQGVVYIQFRIDTLGNVAESYIAKSSNNTNLDKSALNAVKSSNWNPAENQGKPVSVWQTLPFEFKLTQ